MINIDMENVGNGPSVARWPTPRMLIWPRNWKCTNSSPARLSVNRDLEEAMQIKRYVLLHKELDADDEEITRTRKVRRGFVARNTTPSLRHYMRTPQKCR